MNKYLLPVIFPLLVSQVEELVSAYQYQHISISFAYFDRKA